jgi:protein disulfide-isomerase
MKTFFASVAALLATAALSFAADAEWMTDFTAAKAKAKAEKKVLLVDFTGSDWCGWCIRLDKEVFAKKEFQDYAAEKLVLVKLDFPQTKKLAPELEKQNKDLAKKYDVQGFPTIKLLKPSGSEIAETGYQEGGPVKYVEHLKQLLK